jgi:hypothetical protein
MNIAQNRAAAPNDYNRLALNPVAHLGKRMPNVAMIKFGDRIH